ncbi:TRZ/ATZ family hydrolase [Nitrosomonas sp. Nm58]|uniref:TRZ/ATZ family hydrolase n=1 Tax=Nitrosomonas sp. Nm58 TaxID=200126 RepID=UPI000895494D|nr:TRZ/ATZ family hydrolase [Nitrosomonas sp. Nm58]SDY32278.1 5-methylthioadenosine/S-adenosylhomocysteine deaminase [Nitrosomonas sp. Nm58]
MISPVIVDTVIEARWIIPVEPEKTVLIDHAIVIDDGIIKAIVPSLQACSQFTPLNHITLDHHAIIPGLINLHTHAAMVLMRGLADDLPLMEWLNHHIWPAETRFVDANFVLDGATLACAEMLKGGITCFNDMYFFPEITAKAAIEMGMRAAIGLIAIDLPSSYASDADDYLAKGLVLRDQYPQHPLLSFCFAPHAPYTVSDKTLTNIMTYAEQLNLPVHIHLHETIDEIRNSLDTFGLRPIARLHQLGLLSPNLIAVHTVHLTNKEISLLKQQNCNIAHCPSSNLKLASGFAPVTDLLAHGINVGIGTDSAASNNRLDMFEEMRLTALLAKANSNKAEVLPARQALRMATLNGAIALGLDKITGSLSIGKAADITAIDFSGLTLSSCFDPVSHLVYVAGREHVSHVWVNGKLLLDEGELVNLNEMELINRAIHWQKRLNS